MTRIGIVGWAVISIAACAAHAPAERPAGTKVSMYLQGPALVFQIDIWEVPPERWQMMAPVRELDAAHALSFTRDMRHAKGKLISSPRIATLEGRSALVSQRDPDGGFKLEIRGDPHPSNDEGDIQVYFAWRRYAALRAEVRQVLELGVGDAVLIALPHTEAGDVQVAVVTLSNRIDS